MCCGKKDLKTNLKLGTQKTKDHSLVEKEGRNYKKKVAWKNTNT